MLRRPDLARLPVVLAAAWLLTVMAIAIARAVSGHPAVASLASSPHALAHGQVWRLLTSALVIQGPPVLQIVATAALASVLIKAFGAGVFWLTALGGHIGSTLLAYAGVEIVWIADHEAVAGVLRTPDYGISAVWAACLGTLLVAGVRGAISRARAAGVVGVGALLVFLVAIPADGELYDFEHFAAFLVGAGLAAWRLR